MSKHAIPVEIVVEAPTWAIAREQVVDLLARLQIKDDVFHYKIINGEAEG